MVEVIYILLLEKDKIYVGRTMNLKKRYNQHLNGNGSFWTKKYKPIEILDTYVCSNPFEEDMFVKMYMSEYGIENVRGGSYVQYILDDNQMDLLLREIRFTKNLCINCGESNHFVKNCNVCIVYECVVCSKEFSSKFDCSVHIESHHKKISFCQYIFKVLFQWT